MGLGIVSTLKGNPRVVTTAVVLPGSRRRRNKAESGTQALGAPGWGVSRQVRSQQEVLQRDGSWQALLQTPMRSQAVPVDCVLGLVEVVRHIQNAANLARRRRCFGGIGNSSFWTCPLVCIL